MFLERIDLTPVYVIVFPMMMYSQWLFKKSEHRLNKRLGKVQLSQHTTAECCPDPQLEDVPQSPLRALAFPWKYLQMKDKITFRPCCSPQIHSLQLP